MVVKDYIEAFFEEHEHSYEASTVLRWINLVESNIYADNIEKYLATNYHRVLNEYQFDLPNGVGFEDVKKLHVNGVKYRKKDVRAYKELNTYWYEGDKLCIYPACAETDPIDNPKIRIVYLSKPEKKLIANIDTDTLLIPDRFSDIYDYYLMAKIAYNDKEYSEYENHMVAYNSRVADYVRWWEDNRPMKPIDEIVSSDDVGYSESSDFDWS